MVMTVRTASWRQLWSRVEVPAVVKLTDFILTSNNSKPTTAAENSIRFHHIAASLTARSVKQHLLGSCIFMDMLMSC